MYFFCSSYKIIRILLNLIVSHAVLHYNCHSLSDWCLLAVKLGLVDKLPKLDTSSGVLNKASQTARLLDEWEQHTSSKIGEDWQVLPFASTISIMYITRIQMCFRWLHKMCWGYRSWGRCERPALRLLPLPDHHPGRVDGVNARHRLIRIRAVSYKQHKHHRISCWSCAAGLSCLLIVSARLSGIRFTGKSRP